LEKEIKDLSEMYGKRIRFKFLESLCESLNRLKELVEKEHLYFFTALNQYKDDLLDDKENVIDATKRFMNGSQLMIFEKVLTYLESNNANFDYIGSEKIAFLQSIVSNPTPYKGNLMQEANEALNNIQSEISAKQETERNSAIASIQSSIDKLKKFNDFNKFDEKQKSEILAPFEKIIKEIETERFIGNIRSKAYNTTSEIYQRQLEKMTSLVNSNLPSITPTQIDVNDIEKNPYSAPKISFISKDSIKINFKKPALETKQDVEEYLEVVKEQVF
jgi:hypothetical protein